MADFDNRNTFTLFRNTRKQEETHADFNGTFTDKDGTEYWINAWSKTPKNGGEKFLSGKIKPKVAKAEPRVETRQKLDDEIPF